MDQIFTDNMKACMTELATQVKKDPVLNHKWNCYLGMDMYMPTLAVWYLTHERARKDVKRRLTKHAGFVSMPYF